MATQRLDGKVFLVTGASSGIGLATAEELVRLGARVFFACRSESKTRPLVERLNVSGPGRADFIPLDLGDLASVRACAARFLALGLPLHGLINNAGLAGAAGLTPSGFELAFGTCHVGHFVLTGLLLDRLKASAPSRIVVVASKMHRHADSIDFDAVRKPTRSPGGLKEYAVAKLANILFVRSLAQMLEGSGVTTYALHPGVVASDVWRSVPRPLAWLAKHFMISNAEGATTSLYCATSPACAGESGLYYDSCRVKQPSAAARDDVLAKRLWQASEDWVRA